MKKVAINGMGRTGRVMLRRWLTGAYPDVDIIAVNDIVDIDNLVYLLRYDSVFGRLPCPVEVRGNELHIDGRCIEVHQQAAPETLPWKALGVEAVIESTGQFTSRDAAAKHLTAGAERVLIGAPSPDADFTMVLGVNHEGFEPDKHHVVSNASCTTNSLVPALTVLKEAFGLQSVAATTVHAYTASQSVVDKPAKKMHRGRAAGVSMIPTTTGADKAAVQVMPELAGHISASAIRVPVPDGSLTDITAQLKTATDPDAVNAALKAASTGALEGILGYSEDELVSVDILGEPYSGLVHAQATRVTGNLAKIFVWYDNETGYASRCLDVVGRIF